MDKTNDCFDQTGPTYDSTLGKYDAGVLLHLFDGTEADQPWLPGGGHGHSASSIASSFVNKTIHILWDWIYIDELLISSKLRGEGLGRQLMQLAEEFAKSQSLQGVWLWTQSWQAEGFYRQLGYSQFTRFDNFPEGHSRIGFRKKLT